MSLLGQCRTSSIPEHVVRAGALNKKGKEDMLYQGGSHNSMCSETSTGGGLNRGQPGGVEVTGLTGRAE